MKRLRGQSILYVVLLMPTLILILSLTIDLGQLQMERLRLRYAVDLAAVSGASSVDAVYYSQTGRLRLDRGAALATTRAYLDANLTAALGSRQAANVAGAADITVINDIPGVDPYTGTRLDRPSVCARIHVRYRLSLIGFLGRLGLGSLNVASTAEIRP
ncbi:MAG: hypothetical protein PVSMB9_07280 [Candidatus Dormibacteria bacterium]